ncbi:hypothetical protein H072_2531 [Dactylellina haptotyla CBS 200.50]|uniref:U6 small nuclear RNA (adenine-(43)-N(6))-methyltransferase n=1 Tax=Dactylellina haptotyla (strain CBS 200.50) TaxID=1284197 RepID=S8AKM5_DACHA|nr:hypothetical protein H072_2531 [Dactylellina haptotyla CBS 200.50]
MHPRNIYQDTISFAKLAKDYPDFAKCLKGRNSIDFHDPEAVRQLAKALLKRDFNLDVDLPEDRLCPAIPNRLNYILWLNDLITDTHGYMTTPESNKVVGVDIGTGASAIYPLLGCSHFPHWQFITTDIDSTSLSNATRNIQQNSLDGRVTIVDVSASPTIFPPEVTENSLTIDFAMCNPPFYTSINDMLSSAKLKSVPPLSACTGSTTEMVTEGGEVSFVGRMVDESLKLREKIRWYTSMLGKLGSVEKIVDKLKQNGVSNYVVGEFVQGVGKTKRWAVGWSFSDQRAGDHLSRQPTSHSLKVHLPFPTTFRVPLPMDTTLSSFLPRVEELLKTSCSEFPTDTFEWTSVRLPYFTTMYGTIENLYSNGKGETNGNTWSRAARRKRKQLEALEGEGQGSSTTSSEPKFGFAVGIFIDATIQPAETAQKVRPKTGEANDVEDNEIGDEADAWDHDFISLPKSSVEPETNKGSFVLLRWTRGVDQVLWESFCGMLRRKILDGLVKPKD